MGESTFHEFIYRFCRAVNWVFGELHLKAPIVEDTRQLLPTNEAREFPSMIGSIDCMLGSGISVHLHGRISIVTMPRDTLLFWRQWHRKIYGFDTLLFLAYPLHTMILMCSTALRCSLVLR